MYHAFVLIDGQWISFGLHVPGNQWSTFYNGLQKTYSDKNVASSFWGPEQLSESIMDVRMRTEEDVELANRAYATWSKDRYAEDEGKRFNLSRRIATLRTRHSLAALE